MASGSYYDTVFLAKPKKSTVRVFFSPADEVPKFKGIDLKLRKDYYALENYTMNKDDTFIKTAGFIKGNLAIKRQNDERIINGLIYDFETNQWVNPTYKRPLKFTYQENIIIFENNFEDGDKINISYKTDILEGFFETSEWEKTQQIKITHKNRTIDYTHRWAYNGFYRLPRNVTLNIGEIYSLDVSEFSGCVITWYQSNFKAENPYYVRNFLEEVKEPLPTTCDEFGDVFLKNQTDSVYYFEVTLKSGKKLPLKKLIIHWVKLEVSDFNAEFGEKEWQL